jgi:hypothetical protein
MGLGSLFGLVGKAVGAGIKVAPKISKALGSINNASKAFGQISQSGRAFGSLANNVSGGRLANSKFGQTIEKLVDKADVANSKIASVSSEGQSKVNQAVDKLKQF